MKDKYFTSSKLNQITFANSNNRKIKKNINVKGFFRKGKFVRAFDREQDVREKVVKVAVASLAVLGGVLGIGVATAALTKVRYNRNLVNFGNRLKIGANKSVKMKVPEGAKYYKAPTSTIKKSMTFFIGGREAADKMDGEVLMEGVAKSLKKIGVEKNHEFIPLYHRFQGSKQAEGTMGIVKSIQENLEASALKGYNPDSLAMADEIYKWHKLNLDKPIQMITHSAGGFQGRDIPHILVSAGVDKKLIKVFSTGSPDFGLVDDIVATKRVINLDDVYAKSIPGFKKGQQGIPSLHRNTEFVEGSLSPEYKELVMKKARMDAQKAGKPFNEKMSEMELKMAAHLHPAYYRTKTKSPAAQKTLDILQKFLFED
jgi:hypothetical protein